jgi:cell fate regulator YaaT (PSP1 superfamily)
MELAEAVRVVAKTQHGTEVGMVLKLIPPEKSGDYSSEPFIKELVRPFSEVDSKTLKDLEKAEKEAFTKARDLIRHHKLAMKLLRAEYLFDSTRLILYYKAEHKVDFRELLKSLASTFRTRIELRQIGVRDETKLLGGIGCCGKEVCCAQFMNRFHPVSTKMAKDQGLSMNPAKLSGICCRLLCCIAHEHKYYAEFQGKYPRVGAEILLGTEKGRVIDLNFLTLKAVVAMGGRQKTVVPLQHIFGRKDRDTGRNLWWVQEPGQPEPDLSLLLQANVPPPAAMARPPREKNRRDSRPRSDTGNGNDRPATESVTSPQTSEPEPNHEPNHEPTPERNHESEPEPESAPEASEPNAGPNLPDGNTPETDGDS